MYRATPWFRGTRVNYAEEVGDPWTNSIVATCIQRKAVMLRGLTLTVQKWNTAKAKWEVTQGPQVSQALAIFRRPNPYYNGNALLSALALSWDSRGHAFFYKRRDNAGRLIGFWYMPHNWVQVLSDRDNADGLKLITHYRYTPYGLGPMDLPYEDVLMTRNGIDPLDTRCGLSPLYGQLREISADNQAAGWLDALLRNGAAGSQIMTPEHPPAGGDAPTPEQLRAMRDLVNETVADARGQAVIVPFPMKVNAITFSPKDVEIGAIRAIPTDRICSALGGDPMAFGLPSDSKTYNNIEEAMDALGNMTILPMADDIAEQWSQHILPEFGMDPETFRYYWDRSDVSWLADETQARDENNRANFESGIIDRYRAKEVMGETPDKEDKGVTYFDLQARANGLNSPADAAKKQTLSDWAIRMGEANKQRLENAGRKPGVMVHKMTRDKLAQATHNRNINKMDRAMMQSFESYKNGSINLETLKEELSQAIYDGHKAQYTLGLQTGGATPTKEQVGNFTRTVTDVEQEFLLGFLQDVADGRYDGEGGIDLDGALRQRVGLYALKSSSSASAGFVAAGTDTEEYEWRLGVAEHCPDCEYIATLSPFDASTAFTHPREGDTVCLGNCKCQWVRVSDGLAPFGPVE
jgi:HK97 family phage portal protein